MAEEAPQQSAAPKDKSKMLVIAFMVVNGLVLAAGTYLVFISTIGYSPVSITEDSLNREIASFEESLRGRPVMYTLPVFNTNLDGIPRRLVRMEVSLEMLDKEGFEEVVGLGSGARDAIVRVLNDKSFDDIESVQGKLHLKNQIVTQLNERLRRGVVKNIYFSDLVVQ